MHIAATQLNTCKVRSSRFSAMLFIGLLCILSGCAGLTENSDKSGRVESKKIDPVMQKQLYQLEDQANLAIQSNHLTHPEKGSALALFGQMLSLNPGNKEAIRGIEQVVEQYIALALTAADERLFAKAKSMLARARLVDANHPSLQPTMRQIRLLEKAQHKTIALQPKQMFSQSGQKKISALVNLGNKNCRYTIAATNDEQGRWIYKAIKNTTPNGRPKAKIIISSPTKIEQICLTTSE